MTTPFFTHHLQKAPYHHKNDITRYELVFRTPNTIFTHERKLKKMMRRNHYKNDITRYELVFRTPNTIFTHERKLKKDASQPSIDPIIKLLF